MFLRSTTRWLKPRNIRATSTLSVSGMRYLPGFTTSSLDGPISLVLIGATNVRPASLFPKDRRILKHSFESCQQSVLHETRSNGRGGLKFMHGGVVGEPKRLLDVIESLGDGGHTGKGQNVDHAAFVFSVDPAG